MRAADSRHVQLLRVGIEEYARRQSDLGDDSQAAAVHPDDVHPEEHEQPPHVAQEALHQRTGDLHRVSNAADFT